MIVLDILCESGHRFEGWFASADAFHSQCARHLVSCPHCNSVAVSLLPSAPRVKRHAVPQAHAADAAGPEAAERIFAALARAARLAEDVGERFPEEARRIHYKEAPERSIRGRATSEQTRELLDEGISVLPALVPREDEFH